MWSAATSSPSEVGGDIPFGAFHRFVFSSGTRGLCHPAYFTTWIFLEIRERIAMSFWFGIVGSLSQSRGLVSSGRVSVPHRLLPKEVLFSQWVSPNLFLV